MVAEIFHQSNQSLEVEQQWPWRGTESVSILFFHSTTFYCSGGCSWKTLRSSRCCLIGTNLLQLNWRTTIIVYQDWMIPKVYSAEAWAWNCQLKLSQRCMNVWNWIALLEAVMTVDYILLQGNARAGQQPLNTSAAEDNSAQWIQSPPQGTGGESHTCSWPALAMGYCLDNPVKYVGAQLWMTEFKAMLQLFKSSFTPAYWVLRKHEALAFYCLDVFEAASDKCLGSDLSSEGDMAWYTGSHKYRDVTYCMSQTSSDSVQGQKRTEAHSNLNWSFLSLKAILQIRLHKSCLFHLSR